MEYIDGSDLTKLVRDRGRMPVPEGCDAIRQAALGLEHAYRSGLVHRDIKPSNIIVPRAGGPVKLVDLGLALLQAEQERSERLLLSIFPRAIAERLKAGEASVAESYPDATVLLADVSNFNELAAGKRPTEVVGLLDRIFSAFDRLAERYGVEKVKTIGDAYMLAGGLPQPRPDHTEAVADMALAMQQEIVRLNTGLREPFSLRIGIAAGPVVAGVIGTTKFAFDVWGQTVDAAPRWRRSVWPARSRSRPTSTTGSATGTCSRNAARSTSRGSARSKPIC